MKEGQRSGPDTELTAPLRYLLNSGAEGTEVHETKQNIYKKQGGIFYSFALLQKKKSIEYRGKMLGLVLGNIPFPKVKTMRSIP